tara:strand:- start:46 stop:483 length:438 start_codon:yes stop_codon:yes gene_type:complete
MPPWVQAAFGEYTKRLPPTLALELTEIPPGHRGKRSNATNAMEAEAKRLLSAVPKGARKVTLDEHGKAWSTVALAKRLERWMHSGDDIALLVGGPDGLAPSVKSQADESWSLSPLTFPHALVRIIVAEQLYRAWSVLNHHPYHRV